MKKIIFIGFVCALSAQSALAISIGPQVGLTSSNVKFSDAAGNSMDTSAKSGSSFGMQLVVPLLPFLAIEPELRYVQRGFSYSTPFLGSTLKADYTLNYLEIPILAKISIPIPVVSPFLMTGPNYAFNLSNTAELTYGGTKVSTNALQVKKQDFGWDFGLGLGIGIAGFELFGALRYTLGLLNIDATPNATGTVKNRTLNALVGLNFPI